MSQYIDHFIVELLKLDTNSMEKVKAGQYSMSATALEAPPFWRWPVELLQKCKAEIHIYIIYTEIISVKFILCGPSVIAVLPWLSGNFNDKSFKLFDDKCKICNFSILSLVISLDNWIWKFIKKSLLSFIIVYHFQW